MNKLLSCRYNMDTNRVEARFEDETTLAIDCIAVEDEYGNTPAQRAELDWLLYNKPLEYAQLVLRGEIEHYLFYTTIYTKKYCHSYWCGNQANNRRQREYRQMRRQDLVCQCCGEKFTPKRAGARYCSNACRQKDYRKRVTDAASAQNEHLVKRNASAK